MLTTIAIILIQLSSMLGFEEGPLANPDLEGILKLAKYASWQPDKEEVRILMAAQSGESYNSAAAFFKSRNLNDKQIVLVPYSKDCPMDDIAIIYIESNAGIDVETLTDMLDHKQILTITNDIENLDKGCMFYINCKDDVLDYKYNKQAVISSGLMIKGSVLAPYHCHTQM